MSSSSTQLEVSIHDRIAVRDVKRFGINIGYHDQFGASQILKNLIINPGFEAGEFATIFLAESGGTGNRVQADHWSTFWNNDTFAIGHPIGFWNGAGYEIVYGAAKGRNGNISFFNHENLRNTFYLSNQGVAPQRGDVVFVRRDMPHFSIHDDTFCQADPTNRRPDSPGEQSLQLLPPDTDWKWSFTYSMDSFWRDADVRAGKLYLAEGSWYLEFWVQGAQVGAVLEVQFERGTTVFYQELIPLTTQWRKIVRRFQVPEGDDPLASDQDNPAVLNLKFRIRRHGGWIDDLVFSRSRQSNPTAFTDNFVALLKELQPGIVRDWGRQLGSSLDNQLAEPFARKTTGHSPKTRIPRLYHYSLHEFLELAQEVGAEPWYVIPPTISTFDLQNLAAYLAAPADEHPYGEKRARLGQEAPWTEVFETIHLEYGNEMWGANIGADPHIGASVRDGNRLGAIAHDRLGEFRANEFYETNRGRFNLIVGGQAFNPITQSQIEAQSSHHQAVAIAPYFGELNVFGDDERMFYPLFTRALQDVGQGIVRANHNQVNPQGTDLAVYELNFHTTEGIAPLHTRNEFVAGLAGGLALPFYMLAYLRDLEIRNQCAFTTAQFGFEIGDLMADPAEYVRLWGLMRDLEATQRPRPTWLGLYLANCAVLGDMLQVSFDGENPLVWQSAINGIWEPMGLPFVHAFAFKKRNEFAVVLFNFHIMEPLSLCLKLPHFPASKAIMYQLTGESYRTTNEEDELVDVVSEELDDWSREYPLTLPGRSMTVVKWQVHRAFFPFLSR